MYRCCGLNRSLEGVVSSIKYPNAFPLSFNLCCKFSSKALGSYDTFIHPVKGIFVPPCLVVFVSYKLSHLLPLSDIAVDRKGLDFHGSQIVDGLLYEA